jgi:hypothetical protein
LAILTVPLTEIYSYLCKKCRKSRRRVGQHVKCNNTSYTCCIQHFFYDRTKKREKTTINNSSVLCVVCEKCNMQTLTFCTIVDRLLTDACNKNFLALVQLRGTFSTKNNAKNTHFLHDLRKKYIYTLQSFSFLRILK